MKKTVPISVLPKSGQDKPNQAAMASLDLTEQFLEEPHRTE